MSKLSVPEIDGKLFFRAGDSLTAEASDLRGFKMSRIFDDACDVGIAVRLETGVVTFALRNENRRDGHITHWDLIPATAQDRRHGIQNVTVFND